MHCVRAINLRQLGCGWVITIFLLFVVAGPRRPLEGDAESTSAAINGQWQAQMQTRAAAIAAQASKAGNDLYNNLATALNERG